MVITRSEKIQQKSRNGEAIKLHPLTKKDTLIFVLKTHIMRFTQRKYQYIFITLTATTKSC